MFKSQSSTGRIHLRNLVFIELGCSIVVGKILCFLTWYICETVDRIPQLLKWVYPTGDGQVLFFAFENDFVTTVQLKKINLPSYGPWRKKTCLWGFANNTGADQPAHPHSLISAFVIPFLKHIICKLATGEISIFQLISVAEETGLKLALAETLKIGFLATRPIFTLNICWKFKPLSCWPQIY